MTRGPALPWGEARLFVAVFCAYVLGAWVAFELLRITDLGAVFFAPAGVTVGALLVSPPDRWLIVLAAAATAELSVDRWYDIGLWPTIGYVAANTAGPLLGAAATRAWCGRRPNLAVRRHLAAFVAAAVVTGPALGAAIGASTASTARGRPFGSTFLQWWLGDGLGVLLVGAAILAVQASPGHKRLLTLEGTALLAATVTLAVAVHWSTDLPAGFVLLAPVVLAGARFGTSAVTVTSLLVGTIGVLSHTMDDTLLVGVEDSTAFVLVKLQLAALALAGLVIAAESYERERAVRVSQRTAARASVEHAVVEELQRALLPPSQTEGDHFSATGVYRSAVSHLRVGGDWYDVRQLGDGRVFISVGDVVGHGTAAVSVMGQLRFGCTIVAGLARTPGEVLDQMDEFVTQFDAALCTTVWTAMFDPVDGHLSYASAGHPPALLVEADGRIRRLDEATSVPLGAVPGIRRPSASAHVAGSASLVVYTDGLVERRGETIDEGVARLEAAVAAHGAEAVDDIVAATTEDVLADDAVLLRVSLSRAVAAELPLDVASEHDESHA